MNRDDTVLARVLTLIILASWAYVLYCLVTA
jgi:hypothetical protein